MFRIVELIMSCVCFSIHVYGVITLKDKEDLPHDVIFCGAFMGYIFVSTFAIAEHLNNFMRDYIEVISSIVGFILFIVASIYSMVVVEHDPHLVNLTEAEEIEHPFFEINRLQSILALITSKIFLLHATLAIDYGLMEKEDNRKNIVIKAPDQNLYFFPEEIWNKFKK
jgi:formate hydrogenlyase subunit 3/multisubunit Na+/H+ antiporter MnhD subunit